MIDQMDPEIASATPGNSRTPRVATLVVLGLVVAAVGVAQAASPGLATKTSSTGLPNDNTTHVLVTNCGGSSKVVGGGVRNGEPSIDYLQGTFPKGRSGWKGLAYRATSAVGSSTTKTFARCIAGAPVVVRSKTVVLPGTSTPTPVVAKCPSGTRVTGGGAELGDNVNDFVQGTYPKRKHAWKAVGYRPFAAGDATVTAHALCLGDGRVTQVKKSKPMGAGLTRVVAKCPRGSRVLGGGTQIEDDLTDYVSGSYPKGKRSWVAEGHGTSELIAHATCLA